MVRQNRWPRGKLDRLSKRCEDDGLRTQGIAMNVISLPTTDYYFHHFSTEYDRLYRLSPLGTMITDAAKKIVYINPAFEAVTGYTTQEALNCTPEILHSGRHSREFYQTLWLSLQYQGWWQGEIWNRRKNGQIYPEWLTINRICTDDGSGSRYLGVFLDISARKQQEETLHFDATHDSLTGLANYALMKSHLCASIQQARAPQCSVAVLYIDLDRFKPINDCYGHEQGDLLLKLVAERLQANVRTTDFVARAGGDEFVVVLDALQSPEGVAQSVAQMLISALSTPFRLGSHLVNIGCSIGIGIFPSNGITCSELLNAADSAMYRAKRDGGGRFISA
jgi:diguanylate cyclase (GGDEF)-like protein/PAS domain S-box-containing protein